jgi:phosphoglycerate dehydrogenase-like enzyme
MVAAQPAAAVVPDPRDELVRAVVRGGGRVEDAERADVVIWTDPNDPLGLRDVLGRSRARWVQLPLAGIEEFVAQDVLDPERTWTSAKGIYGRACAEQALTFMLAGSRRIHEHIGRMGWRPETRIPHRQLQGSVVALVGTGGIGRALRRLLRPFRVRLLAVNRSGDPFEGADRTATKESLPEIAAQADFLILAAALTDETRHIVNAHLLSRMQGHAWVVNVARGGLIDTPALVEALNTGAIGGAGLDVTEPEPLPDGHALWECRDALITPHVANTLDMSLPQLEERVRRNVRRFAQNRPLEGLVDPVLGY